MRISTAQIYRQGVEAFGNQQVKLAKLQQQISTGIRISRPSDDPAASSRILELEETISLNMQYQTNIGLAENRLNQEENSITSMEHTLMRIRELSLQANNATQDSVSRRSIAFEIDQLLGQLLSLANTVDANGDYLFAGYQSRTQPFTKINTGSISHVTFNGDAGLRSIQINQNRQMNIDTQGRDLLMAIPSATALNETVATANVGSAIMAPAHVYDIDNYIPDSYTITFDTVSSVPNTVYNIVNSVGVTVSSGTYADSQNIDFMGIRTSVAGVPANGDRFTISQGQYQDIFEIVSNLSETLKTGGTGVSVGGSYTFGSAVTVFDYSADSASFEVDGNLVSLNANYSDLGGLTTEIQTQLDAAAAGVYAVSNNGVSISIARIATGTASTAPVVNNFNGDVDLDGAAATSGSATTAAVTVTDYSGGADISFDVDGFAIVLNANYTNLAGVTSEIQADLNAAAGPGVYNVTDNGTAITIAKIVTGAVSTAPVINNPGGAGANQAEFTGAATTNGIDATNTVADFVIGGVATNGKSGSVISTNVAQTLTDLDTSFNKMLAARTSIGGRLNVLESQLEDNEAYVLTIKKMLSTLRDTDLADAISQLVLEQTTLDAAQAVFAKITSSSLFNFLR